MKETTSIEAGTSGHEELRRRHLDELQTLVPEHIERTGWSAERLRAERTARLRALLETAKERSTWHRERLAGVDPHALEEADIERLPVMRKGDLMANFDEIVTDRRLTLDLVESHLTGLSSDAYLLDRYHAVASGGSSGRRGVFVWSWESWARCYAGFVRYTLRERLRDAELAGKPLVMASVVAEHATHISSALSQTFSNPMTVIHHVPITQPLERIVARLNEAQPETVVGYPSVLYQLAFEAEAGRLRIAPRAFVGAAEPLLPEIRAALERNWVTTVHNCGARRRAGRWGSRAATAACT